MCMDALQKLAHMGSFMQVETAEEQRAAPSAADQSAAAYDCSIPIHMAALPNGRRVPMLKSLLTSACERNCYYCPFRAGRDFRRQTFKPEEFAQTFYRLYQKGIVKGLFLSSGIAGGGIRTQDKLIATAEILRNKIGFKDYIHLKLMPGAEKAQVERAMQLADRVSVNLEGPSDKYLARLAPQKVFVEELLQPLRWVEEIRHNQPGYAGWNGHWPSSVTQFVVGAAGESDVDLLRATDFLHKKLRLSRVYFSGFSPVYDTPLENLPATDPWREHRLYQASFLLRDYGFSFEELPFTGAGALPLETDPKLAWARANLTHAPIEINRADREHLLRIPGIGLRGAQAILTARRQNRLRTLEDLKALGILSTRTAPFVLLDGRRPPAQLTLW